MSYWLWIACGGLAGLCALVLGGIFLRDYLRYLRSPEKRWRDRVLGLADMARRRAEAERAALQRVGVRPGEESQLRAEAFARLLAGVSLAQLDAFPGIGPATLGKLRAAGRETLADLEPFPAQVEGLGPKRLADVKKAVRSLVRQARGKFDAGACPEAVELGQRLAALRASRSEDGARALARYEAAVAVAGQLRPAAELARRITFVTYVQRMLRQLPPLPALPETFPDLEQAVRAADAAARERFTASAGGTPPVAVPAVGGDRAAPPMAVPVQVGAVPADDLFRHALQSAAPVIPVSVPVAPKAREPLPVAAAKTPAEVAPPPEGAAPVESTEKAPTDAERRALLEIDPAAPLSADLVRRQFNLLSERYAPEKFTAAGPEFVEVARRKRDAVRAAAAALIAPFGEPLEIAAPAAPPELRHNPDLDAIFGG